MSPEYPTDEQLEAIKAYHGNDADGMVPLIEAAYNQHYGAMRLEDAHDDILDRPLKRLTLITGGWSGNEDIIHALETNAIWWMVTWRLSERGGRYVFEWKKEEPK
jgi:hypothetical protein